MFYSNSIDYGLTFSEKVQKNTVDDHVVVFGGASPRVRYYNDKIYVIWADLKNGYNNTSIYLNYATNNGQDWIDDFG